MYILDNSYFNTYNAILQYKFYPLQLIQQTIKVIFLRCTPKTENLNYRVLCWQNHTIHHCQRAILSPFFEHSWKNLIRTHLNCKMPLGLCIRLYLQVLLLFLKADYTLQLFQFLPEHLF